MISYALNLNSGKIRISRDDAIFNNETRSISPNKILNNRKSALESKIKKIQGKIDKLRKISEIRPKLEPLVWSMLSEKAKRSAYDYESGEDRKTLAYYVSDSEGTVKIRTVVKEGEGNLRFPYHTSGRIEGKYLATNPDDLFKIRKLAIEEKINDLDNQIDRIKTKMNRVPRLKPLI